jgi:hypothetical protein
MEHRVPEEEEETLISLLFYSEVLDASEEGLVKITLTEIFHMR